MEPTKLQEMIEKKRKEAKEKAEARIIKIRERAEEQIKKAEEKAKSVEVDEEKLTKAVELQEQIKGLQEELKGLGIRRTGVSGVVKGPRPKSVSGKYPSVRALAEEMFEENEKVTADEFLAAVRVEFPDSRATKADFNWLKNKILYHGEWKTRGTK